MVFLWHGNFSGFYHLFVILKNGVFCEMVILVVFNSFNVVKNLKKPDPVARQMPPFYTTKLLFIKVKCSINIFVSLKANLEGQGW